MNQEKKTLFISMLNNGLISSLKIASGIIGKSSSLLADGFHTGSDFITDVIALIGSFLSKKKPDKVHPFGYGKVEYISSLFIGIIILGLGVFLLIESFHSGKTIPSPWVIGVICLCLILKFFSCIYLSKQGKKLKSNVLITSSKESYTDAYSSIMVLVVSILMQFSNQVPILKHMDMIGSIGISILILIMGFNVVSENVLALLGEKEDDKELIKEIEKEVETVHHVEVEDITLVKYGFYYRAHLKISIDENIKISQLIRLEKKINQKIKKKKFKIRYTTIELVEEQ